MANKTAKIPNKLIVQKYGGSSLAEPQQIRDIADRIATLHHQGYALIIVVSAMGKTTDQLVELAYRVSSQPNRRELDMLLTTGERISMSLVSMALNDRRCPAISFTGSQAGVLTDELHSNARIMDIKPTRVETELGHNHVVVLAGFQGVSPRSKEVTTLGRGGSDTTAVAMAAVFKAECCEIRKDVDGVYSGDPRIHQGAVHLPNLNYQTLLDMTFWGAKVLHYRSVELASLLGIPLLIALAHGEGRSTKINGDVPMFEQARILSVNSHANVRRLSVTRAPNLSDAFQEVARLLKDSDLPLPQFLDAELVVLGGVNQVNILITAPVETLTAISQICKGHGRVTFEAHEFSSVTATCQGAFASPLPGEIASELSRHGIATYKMIFGAMSLTAIVDLQNHKTALEVMHNLRPPS